MWGLLIVAELNIAQYAYFRKIENAYFSFFAKTRWSVVVFASTVPLYEGFRQLSRPDWQFGAERLAIVAVGSQPPRNVNRHGNKDPV